MYQTWILFSLMCVGYADLWNPNAPDFQTYYYVEFFKNTNYYDFLVSAYASKGCTNLPTSALNRAMSVWSSECLMLFSYGNCQGRSYEIPAYYGSSLPFFERDVDSFRLCEEHEKHRSNNWVNNDAYKLSLIGAVPKRIELFDNNYQTGFMMNTIIHSTCTNLPTSVMNKASSVNTDICVMLYSYPDCRGNSFQVNAGRHSALPYFNNDADSFRPCKVEDVLENVASVHNDKFIG